jgi:AcrR family transcriptional regulator
MDRRTRKTREALYSAFISLIVERGYDAISVQDIIDAADVGRTTFYAHFKSKDELLISGFHRLRDELHSLMDAADTRGTWTFVEPLLQHAKAHRGLYLALLKGGGGRLADREFQSIVEEMVVNELGGRSRDHTSVALLSGALIGAVRSWIEIGTSDRPAGMVAAFCAMAGALPKT